MFRHKTRNNRFTVFQGKRLIALSNYVCRWPPAGTGLFVYLNHGFSPNMDCLTFRPCIWRNSTRTIRELHEKCGKQGEKTSTTKRFNCTSFFFSVGRFFLQAAKPENKRKENKFYFIWMQLKGSWKFHWLEMKFNCCMRCGWDELKIKLFFCVSCRGKKGRRCY